jgi:hypothetical protein
MAEDWKRIEERAEPVTHDLDTAAYDLGEMADDATAILSRQAGKDGDE